ncbi:transposase family protein [Streptomyces sp. NPDC127051]|uniref:transposase family protein n=1 Tax=Streptomyces sp. NPDC127051 TaxID=3347119 RepID=UPI00365A7CE0
MPIDHPSDQTDTHPRNQSHKTQRNHQGAGDIVAVPHRRKPGKDLTLKQKCVSRAHARLRWPVERAIAEIKTWRILRKARCHPTRLTSITKAILTLETHR